MKAVRIHHYGDAGVLAYEDTAVPVAAPGEVLVRVVATSVNPVDWKVRAGYLKSFIPHELPLILGWDVSGVVEAVGPGVSRFKTGDAVYSRPDLKRNGTYAEYVVVRETELAYKPRTISHVEAASLPLAGITAWESLLTAAGLEAGQKVLVHGGSGGVGSLAVQLAKDRGAHVVATTSSRNQALVESLGADQVIDYRTQDFTRAVRDCDVVLDTIGGAVQEASWSVVRRGGVLVSIISSPSEDRARGAGARAAFVFIDPNAPVLEQLARLVDGGRMRPVIGAEFALEDMAAAHALSESGRAVGKIAVYVGRP